MFLSVNWIVFPDEFKSCCLDVIAWRPKTSNKPQAKNMVIVGTNNYTNDFIGPIMHKLYVIVTV